MDLEAIERALEKCLVAEDACHEVDDHDGLVVTRARWVDAAEDVAMHHGPDLLRLVRAMRFMQDTGAWVAPSGISVPPKDWRPRTRTGWDFDGISICDDFATPLAAIEAAMAAESK